MLLSNVEILKYVITDSTQIPIEDEQPANPPSKAVRLTRRQLAKQEEELKAAQASTQGTTAEVDETPVEEAQAKPVEDAQEESSEEAQEKSLEVPEAISGDLETKQDDTVNSDPSEPTVEAQIQPEESRTPTPSVEVTAELRPEPKMLSSEKPCGEAMTPVMSRASSRRASCSPSKSPMRIEESIEALDALEDALDNVEALTSLHHPNDEKSPRKKSVVTTDKSAAHARTPSKAPLTASKISRNPSAAPQGLKSIPKSIARSTSVRAVTDQAARKGSADPVDYLASKRRPISVSFPTPPPPPKGRAPTKAAFQLSSTAVAEKLKAEKEERLKRQAEGTAPKPRPVSMTLPPKSTKPLTKANFELPGERIAAELKAKREERLLKREAESPQRPGASRPISMAPAPKSTKPPTKANFELPGSAVAAKLKAQREERLKRQEEAEAARKAAALTARPAPVRKPVTMPTRVASAGASSTTSVTIPPLTQAAPAQDPATRNKRNSMPPSHSPSSSPHSSNRHSTILSMSKSTVTPVDAAAQKLKGREVFNRDKMEKEARERERKDKEEAAKKARADAAERGRIASREWAERQRKKMMVVPTTSA